jgi:D-arabinose 1-dehydrogenase-like Zn-dependent alcohol dehydrogenase
MVVATIKMGGRRKQEGRSHARHSPHRLRQSRQGLEFVQIPEPAAPSPGQALIGVEFSPIDLSDLLVVSGAYPSRPSLPSVIGNEGVGRRSSPC